MSWSRQKGKKGDAWSLGESAQKRRKLDSEGKGHSSAGGKDDFDDSMELTQAELETLDVMASQAIVEEAPGVGKEDHTTETGAAEAAADEMLFFAKPSLKLHGLGRRSTSSSSGSSAHPGSLSSRSASDASGSLSSHTSENGKTEVDTVQNLRSKLEEEVKKAQEEKYRSAGEMAFLRESLRRQEDELEKIRADRDAAKEKEKLAQKDSEKMLQARLDSMASEAQFKDREFKNLQEQYLSLQHKLKRLEQDKQHHFSPGSATEASSPKLPSPRKVPVRPSPPSKQKLRQMEESNVQRGGFPTTQSFLEQAPSSPRGSPSKVSVSNTGCQTTGTFSSKQKRRLKLKNLSALDTERVSGKGVVQHLLQASPVHQSVCITQTEDANLGLMGLMHAMSTTLRVAGLSYSRYGGNASASLSPIKPKGLTPKECNKDDNAGTLQVVSKEHFQLAVDGLSQLLEERNIESQRAPGGYRDSRNSEELDINKNMNTQPEAQSSSKPLSSVSMNPLSNSRAPGRISSPAALILPLLTDYVQHYVDLLNSPHSKAGSGLARSQHHPMSPYRSTLESTSPSAATSSSFESSLDSLNSSILQLLHEGHVYAASVEGYACAALRCTTLLLLLCPGVGDFILVPQQRLKASTSTFTSSTSGNSSTLEGDAKSEVEADDEKSVSSCEIRILAVACARASASSPDIKPTIQSPVLFHLVLQLAAQDLKDSSCAPAVMAQALHVLTLLCQDCRAEHIPKLQSIATRGVLTNCLRQTSHVPVLVGAVRLLQSMAGQGALLSRLCVKSENCPLFMMHQLNSSKNVKAKNDDMVLFYKEYISCLSSVIAVQQQGLQLLHSSSCPCSNELVPGIVLAMYTLYRIYQHNARRKGKKQRSFSRAPPQTQPNGLIFMTENQEESSDILWTLGQGVTLLHAVAQADTAFLQHHSPVQAQYISLLSGLRAVFKANIGTWEFHLSALEELCDFDPDLSDLSQESESEDRMVQG